MKKLGQNDPCSCGSGKKYKKCCGESNVIPFQPLHLDFELEKLHEQLVQFAVENYEEEIDLLIAQHIDINIQNEKLTDLDTYANLLIAWIIINEPIISDQTVLDIFIKRKENMLKNKKIKEALNSWRHSTSSVFQITSVEAKDKIVHVQEVFSENIYKVYHEEVENLSIGEYIIGTMAPYVHSYQFIFLTVLISEENRDTINEMLELYEPEVESMKDLFPEWLGILMDPGDEELDWADNEHKIVADLFVDHSMEKGLDEEEIHLGVMFWNVYCLKYDPVITKTEAYAAALDYFVAKIIADKAEVTQAKLAQEYNVSSGTISSHYQKFLKEIEEFSIDELSDLD